MNLGSDLATLVNTVALSAANIIVAASVLAAVLIRNAGILQ